MIDIMVEGDGEIGVVNGRADDDTVQIEEGEIAALNEALDDFGLAAETGADVEEPTGEVRQERVVVSLIATKHFAKPNWGDIASPDKYSRG